MLRPSPSQDKDSADLLSRSSFFAALCGSLSTLFRRSSFLSRSSFLFHRSFLSSSLFGSGFFSNGAFGSVGRRSLAATGDAKGKSSRES